MKQSKNPLVSIVTPNYNCVRFISQTIESVLAQTYENWEMLIVDDCSTDGSYEITLDYMAKDSRIKVFRNEAKSGAAISRNVALDNANGEYVAFLDSDDLWIPRKLEIQINFMEQNDCGFCYSRYSLIGEENEPLYRTARIPDRLTYRKLLRHDYIGCLTAIYRRAGVEEFRSFPVKNNNDYGLFLQVVKKSGKCLGVQECLAHYRIRKFGISRKKIRKVKPYFELMHGFLRYPYLLCCYFLLANVLIGKFWKYERGNENESQ